MPFAGTGVPRRSIPAKSCSLGMYYGIVTMADALEVRKFRAAAKYRFFLWMVLRDIC
jgi:hypothetical protein